MVAVVRGIMCGLCCVAAVLAAGSAPATVADVKAMAAVLDNFDMAIGNQSATQNCIGAAKGVIVNNSMSKAHLGKGYWYSFNDAESEVIGADGATPITASNFADLRDTTNKCLKGKIVVSKSSNEYPYAGFGCALTVATEYTDLSKMTALTIKAGGSGDFRLAFKTKDYAGQDWGYYGYDVTLASTAKTISIPVASITPAEGSKGATNSWKWSHGSAEVNEFQIQNIGAADVSFTIDDITIVGMTFADFGWQTSIITGETKTIGKNPFVVSSNRINYSVSLPQNITINLYNALGSRVATLFSGNVSAGDHSVPLNLAGTVADGNYIVKMTTNEGTAVQPLTIAK